MFRRLIFISLTGLLLLTIVWLIVKSTRREMNRAEPQGEGVRQSKPTLTRLLNPGDLEVVESSMELVSETSGAIQTGAGKTLSANHHIVIRNKGSVVYRNIMLEFTYLSASGKTLGTRNQLLPDPVMPGESASIAGFVMESVPSQSKKCFLIILYADMEQAK